MARVVGGIGGSHSSSVAGIHDSGGALAGEWKPYFDTYAAVKDWVARLQPDLAVVFYNDHLNAFRFEQYPTFAVGAADFYPIADEGRKPRQLSGFPGDAEFSWHLAETLIRRDFDPTMCQALDVDHGVTTVLPLVFDQPWPVPIVPVAINVIQHPLPRPARTFRLGQVVREAIETDGTDRRVLVIGTGGLSHHLQGSDFGYVNPEWDRRFLDQLDREPEALAELTIADYLERGGSEGVEAIIWLAMRGALGRSARCAHRHYHPGLLTGCAVVGFEEADMPPPAAKVLARTEASGV